MTAGHLPRRLVVGACSAALLAGAIGAVPLLGSASAAGCATWTDDKGDSIATLGGAADPTGVFTDANLDIVSSTFGTVGDTVVGTITTDGLIEDSSDLGDEFGVNFTVAGVNLFLYADRARLLGTPYPPDPIGAFEDVGVSNGSDFISEGTATYDVAKKTVTIVVKLVSVATAAGKPVAGQVASGLSSYTSDQFALQPVVSYDESATTQSATLGEPCGGTPVGSATPVPSGSATPTPSASASPRPSATPSPTAPTSGGLFDQPRKGCLNFKDVTGDADPTGTGVDNEDALDVTQVNLKSPSGALQLFVGLVDPSAALLDIWDGPVYTVTFTVGGKVVSLSAPGTGPATATVGTAANSDIKATAKVDAKAKNIVFTVPLAGLSKATATVVKRGTPITSTSVATEADSLLGPQPADSATGANPAQKTYSYGDNSCFLPPPGVFTLDADRTGQYSDRTLVFATLNDADGSPVPGVRVTGALTGGRPVVAKTDSDGIADLFLPLTMATGSKTLTVTYAGDAEVGATRGTKAFTVVAEKTILRLVALRGGAQATVLDDDRHAVVGRYVRIVIGSKTFLRKTSSRGIVVVTGVRKGTAIKVTFLPVRGYYLGTPTYTVRAR